MSFSNLRLWDYCAAQRPDYMITISDHVKKRCEKYYRRKAEVIRPPMMLGDSGGLKALKGSEGLEKLEGLKNYYLVVSRLVPYKKVDLAIEVCNRLRQPLVIVGEGTEKKKLKKMSGPTVKFAGNLTEGELVGYYRRARALLMPQEEDFGLAAVEAASLGVPVVSYKHSGVVETVRDGENGVWFEEQTAKSLIGAISRLEVYETSSRWKFRKQKFSPDRFKKEFKGKIKELWRQH